MSLYNEQGEPVDILEWAAARTENPWIKRDSLKGMLVSTVFVGIDMGSGDGPPLLYETMVFPSGTWNEVYTERYPTSELAVLGHVRAVEWVEENY